MQNKILHHLLKTYMDSRRLLMALGILFPWLLWLGNGFELEASISANYHSPMQDVFVGVLFVVGALLVAYKGYSKRENVLMNIAGVMAMGIALFPTLCDAKLAGTVPCPGGDCAVGAFAFLGEAVNNWLHRITSLLFFGCIAYVCWFHRKDTLYQLDKESDRQRYDFRYRVIAILLVALPLLVTLFHYLFEGSRLTFWLEVVSMWVFSAYWMTKGHEIKRSALEDINA